MSFLDVAFRAARAADPGALLYLNEVVADWQGFPQKFDALLALVQGMQSRGVPIDGIGLQGHFFLAPPDRAYLEGLLRRIGALGLQVEFTELDIPMVFFRNAPDPLAAQAQAYADVVAACMAVSACTGITTWGIDDGDTWLDSFMVSSANAPNRPLLFDAMGRPKPAYDAVVRTLLPAPGSAVLVPMALGAVALRARWAHA